MKNIKNYKIEDLQNIIKKWGYPIFHARQIFNWIYSKSNESFWEMSNLSKDLRAKLQTEFSPKSIKPVTKKVSDDKTVKYLYRLEDDNIIETVIIPQKGRNTLCVSTQVGCKYGCKFCVSGLEGFQRNLKTFEILDQYLLSKKDFKGNITNVVFMGIGEPLDNFKNTVNAVKILNTSPGAGMGLRKITISTCGIVPGIKQLTSEIKQVNLSVSLHSASDKKRNIIMPVNKKYNLRKLIFGLKEYVNSGGREVTFEYILIKNFNDQIKDARQLAKYVKGVKNKINIIPYNENRYFNWTSPNKKIVKKFIDVLDKCKISYTLRKPRGRDIEAACGQLKMRNG